MRYKSFEEQFEILMKKVKCRITSFKHYKRYFFAENGIYYKPMIHRLHTVFLFLDRIYFIPMACPPYQPVHST